MTKPTLKRFERWKAEKARSYYKINARSILFFLGIERDPYTDAEQAIIRYLDDGKTSYHALIIRESGKGYFFRLKGVVYYFRDFTKQSAAPVNNLKQQVSTTEEN